MCCLVHRRPRAGGFTLAELVVVIGIICVLFAVIMPSLTRAKSEAQLAACVQNLKSIGTAYESYLADHPEQQDIGLIIPWTVLVPTYLKSVPICPSTGGGMADFSAGVSVGYCWEFFIDTDGTIHPFCCCVGGHNGLLPPHATFAGPTWSSRTGLSDGRSGQKSY